MKRTGLCLWALASLAVTACATPELLVRHTAPDLGVVDIVVDGTSRGALAPGGHMTIAVQPGVCRVVVQRQEGPAMSLELWVEGRADLDIVPDDAVVPGSAP